MINGPCKAFIPLAFLLITAGCALKFDTQPVKPPVDGTVEPDLDATDIHHDQDAVE
ncbi:MAG: hypothetical protein JRG91_15695, partial [Deltaproteobacteria bacterium]|nr:hypothetical protein [Deltaproteobacteria bacterium]